MEAYLLLSMFVMALALTPSGVRMFKLEGMSGKEVVCFLWAVTILWLPLVLILGSVVAVLLVVQVIKRIRPWPL